MPPDSTAAIHVCRELTQAIGRTRSVEDIFVAALDALERGLGVRRSSILLFDPAGVMRFKAWRNLSADYRRAVEGHTPWQPDSPDPRPIAVADVSADALLLPYLPTFRNEGIAAMAFIPLVGQGRVIGKFMLYYDTAHELTAEDVTLSEVIAAQVAFAVERTRAEEAARRSEERLRFALDAAQMGTWDWDLTANTVRWSDNLERIHGLPAGTFDGSFASYEREIHPEDKPRVLASAQRAIAEGAPHDVEYRIVAPDGTIRWVEGKGRVERYEGRPVSMTGVCMNITRRKEAELSRVEALEEAGRLKDEFLATLSHELRTPLNAIIGWVQILQSRAQPDPSTARGLDIIGRNARLQAQLVNDVLDVSRIVTGKLEMERVPLQPGAIVEAAVHAVRPAAMARSIDLEVDVEDPLPSIEADPRRLEQVLGNLLANALKFTPERGRVTVRCRAAAGAVEIAVCDSGAGIPADFLPFVFDRFRQADTGTTRQYGGLGLGLAIAKYFAERHGGHIEALSDGPGRGSTFRLRLPARLAAAPGSGRGESDLENAGPAPASVLQGAVVLVVDDEADARDLLRALLEPHGAVVVEAGAGAEALRELDRTRVDLMIADIGMPVLDGYALIRAVRQRGLELPALALSAYTRPEDRARALGAGYDVFHPKPLTASALLDQLSALLHRRRLQSGDAAGPIAWH